MRSIFESKKDGLRCELEKALAKKEETEKQADKDVTRLPEEAKVFKLMNYQDEYNNGVPGKPPRYLLDVGSLHVDQGTVKVLAFHAPSILDASTTTMVIETSRDSFVITAPAEGQSAEACQDSEADPASGAAEAPHPNFLSV